MESRHIDTELSDRLWMDLYLKKGSGWLAVQTDSMSPLIQPGNQVLISRVTPEQISRGDVIVFKRKDNLYVHRVMKKWQTRTGIQFIEKGDNTYLYGRCSHNSVIGLVIAVKGNHIYWLTSSSGLIINRALSAWFYWTLVIITLLKSSRNRGIRKTGGILRRLSLLISQAMVRICLSVWYLTGLSHQRNIKPG